MMEDWGASNLWQQHYLELDQSLMDQWAAQVKALEAEKRVLRARSVQLLFDRARLRTMLERFGRHEDCCTDPERCICGLAWHLDKELS